MNELQAFKSQYLREIQRIQSTEPNFREELPLIHDFSPGLYLRRILMPKDWFIIGKTHKTQHMNIILSGSAKVLIEGEVKLVQAGDVFESGAGVKKVLYILEEMVWMTTHVTEETNIEKLEAAMVLTDEEERVLLDREIKLLEEGG